MMSRYLPHLTLLFAILFALSPLASDGFNGFKPDQFPVVQERWPVQPAGWAFSIWGLIYLGLIVYAVRQLLPKTRESEMLRAFGWPSAILPSMIRKGAASTRVCGCEAGLRLPSASDWK